MHIYVAGTVLRQRLDERVRKVLEGLYSQIGQVADQRGHSVQLPYPDENLDQLSQEEFKREILGRIDKADAVISVHYPLNEMVGFETQHAAERGKPQTIVFDPSSAPSLSPLLWQYQQYNIQNVPVEEMIATLEAAVRKTGGEPPQMLVG